MLQHVWERASRYSNLDELIVATDDPRIVEKVTGFGGKAVLTSPEIKSGSDRVAEAVKGIGVDVVINIQGDEPFIEPALIDNLVELFNDGGIVMASAVRLADENDDLSDPKVVMVERDEDSNAVSFNRGAVARVGNTSLKEQLIHIGIYGYTSDFLKKFRQ